MFLSVIIPVYNVAEYLQGCIDSVLANDCADCEVILVDDGATDGLCPGICDENAARYPALIRVIHQENQGLGGARNTGLEAARGEYVFFVDSDDTIAPDSLKILKEAACKTHADIDSFNLYTHDGSGPKELVEISKQYDKPFSLEEHPEFLLSLPAAWARIYRRDLFVNTGIRYPSRVWYEDIRTTTKLFAVAASIVTLPQPLYYYLARPGSIRRSSNIDRNQEILLAFDDILGWFREHGLLQAYHRELARLAVDHIQLAATVRVARMDPKSHLLREFADYMQRNFPDHGENPYLSDLTRQHKFLRKLIAKRQYRLIRLLFRIKDGA